MRGTVEQFKVAWQTDGIIPACAGNSDNIDEIDDESWDHPRVCGEQEAMRLVLGDEQGSSPRVRGTVLQSVGNVAKNGIIPACAGNR